MSRDITVNQSAVLRFSEVDDEVVGTVDGEQVFHSRIVRHNQTALEENITSDLKPGANELRIVATNGPGSAKLKGQLIVDGQTVHEFDEGRHGPGEFADTTLVLDYQGTPVGTEVVLTCSQVDDEVRILVNGERVFSHGLLRHNQPPIKHAFIAPSGSELKLEVWNGLGPSTLIGTLAFAGSVVQTDPLSGDSSVHNGISWERTYKVP